MARGSDGTLRGVGAVVDRDLAAAMPASAVRCTVLLIATDVPHAFAGYGMDAARPIGEIGAADCVSFPRRGTSPTAAWDPRSTRRCVSRPFPVGARSSRRWT
ncbi:carbamate kinase [Sinosporangium album]|uniref:Carbamate kinase n=1 Tax=Sinosporangium album TaxID=504805 RepID=A0A1G7RAW6_9ACTN|nr:carbamate kinase [Sinosporangium album]